MAATGRFSSALHTSIAILATLGTGSGPAAAQPPESRPRPITVTAISLPEPAARDRALAFLRGTGIAIGDTPVARWTDPVCPRVIGLTGDAGRAAETTMRAIALEAGIEVAPEPCDSNVVVLFTAEAAALVRTIHRREPRRMEQLDPVARDALLNGSAPIRWWHVSETRASDSGDDGGVGRSAAAGIRPSSPGRGGGSDLGPDVPTTLQYRNSIISTLSERRLTSATVVIDQDAVMGRRLTTLAAYAALVAYAEIRPGDFRPEGSILGMFGADGAPQGLTSQDLGFLRALYRLPLDRHARYHRGALIGGMVGATTGPETN